MEVLEKTITYRQEQGDWYIYDLTDAHTGTKHCAENDLRKKVQEIANCPTALLLTGGDMGEFISPKDTRWDDKVIAEWLQDDRDNIAECQTDYISNLLKPIHPEQWIGALEGNHEDAMRLYGNVDVQKNLCKRLNVVNLGHSAWIRLRFARENSNERHVYHGVFTHGSGWAQTPGAKINRLQRFMASFDARIYGMGHLHDIICHTQPFLELTDASIIRQKERVGAICGCWFKTYSQDVAASYGEKKDYSPTSLGCPRYVINPTTGMIRVEG